MNEKKTKERKLDGGSRPVFSDMDFGSWTKQSSREGFPRLLATSFILIAIPRFYDGATVLKLTTSFLRATNRMEESLGQPNEVPSPIMLCQDGSAAHCEI